jgi:hypothetical protein
VVTLAGAAGAATAQICPHGIIKRGLTTAEVQMACGDPTLWDQRLVESDLRDSEGVWYHVSTTIDEWTYDLGYNRLVRILTFKDGVLSRIASGGYGPLAPSSPSDRIGIIRVGQSRSHVVLTWGQPHFSDQHQRQKTWIGRRHTVVQRSVTVDTWTYDFGPHRLLRVLTFEDGKLVAIRTGARGHALTVQPTEEHDESSSDD